MKLAAVMKLATSSHYLTMENKWKEDSLIRTIKTLERLKIAVVDILYIMKKRS